MSKLLEEAFTKHAELPEADQDSIATWLLDETVSDGDWKKLLSESGEYLERLADEALAEHSASQTKELDPYELWGRGRHTLPQGVRSASSKYPTQG